MSQLADLAKPFAPRLIHTNPSGGGSYVKHGIVNEKLLAVVGPFDFQLVEIVRGDVAAIDANPNGKSQRAKNGAPALHGAVVGAVARLTVTVDGVRSVAEEAGDCEGPHNWPHDGARLKDAMSDAFKRCAMRLGCGLHLWCDDFFLYDALLKREQAADGGGAASETSPPPSVGTEGQ